MGGGVEWKSLKLKEKILNSKDEVDGVERQEAKRCYHFKKDSKEAIQYHLKNNVPVSFHGNIMINVYSSFLFGNSNLLNVYRSTSLPTKSTATDRL